MRRAQNMAEENKSSETSATKTVEPAPVSFAEFLEAAPPSQYRGVHDLIEQKRYASGQIYYEVSTPELQLHCAHEHCNGLRFFRFVRGELSIASERNDRLSYLTYVCSNCRKSNKIYSLHIIPDEKPELSGRCYKFGEVPPYGPPTPARLIRLFGKERDIFLKGRRCENQGLGIGAFSYYRRVVERQKDQIFDEIVRVSEKIGAPAEMIETLKLAKQENKFSKAVSSVKDAIPAALLVNGHNPLTLLHSALSAGLHAQSDERCLELAHDIRVVLAELSERLGQLLKDEAELQAAVSRLLNSN
jgi:hypothetical protein